MSEMKVKRSISAGVYPISRHNGSGLSPDWVDLRQTVDGYHCAMKPVAQIRRERLAQLIEEDFEGNGAALARHTSKDRKQISAWLNYKNMRDVTAREIEEACLKPLGWLDHENDDFTPPERVSHSKRTDRQKMSDAIVILRELAELQGIPELVSDPIALSVAYDFVVEFDTPLTESNVLDMTKKLAARIRGETNVTPERSSAA
jgi:hypothetical protein